VLSAKSTIGRLLARRYRKSHQQAAMLLVARQGGVTTSDWGELLVQVRRFGLGLRAMGLERGEVVGLIAPGAPESVIALLGCLLVGLPVADLGDGCDEEEVIELIVRAQCSAVICGAREQAESHLAHVREACGERRLVGWGAASSVSGVLPFGQVCLKGAELLEREPMRCSQLTAEPTSSDVALILPVRRRRSQSVPPPDRMLNEPRERYGVQLTHDNCSAAAESFCQSLAIGHSDSILRLGVGIGLVELVLLALSAVMTGAKLIFDAGEPSRQERALAGHPTIILADGDELDALYRDIDRSLLVGSVWRRWLSSWARRVGNEAARRRVSGFENGVLLSSELFIADQFVLSEYRRLLGGAVRRVLSRHANTRRSTRWFFEAIGLSPLGLVGLPESCGVGLLESPADPRPGSYGKAMPAVSVRVDESGRVLIRGPSVAENAVDRQPSGWLPLGISGEIDDDGTVWPERAFGALDASSLAVLPIAELMEPQK
jgi:long-chain acyl-CoA synthetase